MDNFSLGAQKPFHSFEWQKNARMAVKIT